MEEEKKRKGVKTPVLIVICLLLAGLCAGGVYLYQRVSSGLFFEKTVMNGYDVTGLSCGQVLEKLREEYSAPLLEITEGDETALTLSLEQMGYTVDKQKLLNEVEDCMKDQNHNLIQSLIKGNTYEVEIPFDYDEDTFDESVTSAQFAVERVPSTNASMEYDGKEYYIEPETYGNEIDDADLQVMVKDYADKLVEKDRPQEDGTLAIPETFYYLPSITQEDTDMNALMDIYNDYCQAKITLTFGDDKVILDWDTIQNWLTIVEDEAKIEKNKVREFVSDLAAEFDTYGMYRDFETSSGYTLGFDYGEYGYEIDQEAEVEELIADIKANKSVTREPIYSERGVKREGKDDICGTYVEVSIGAQHLWYYKDGYLVIDTDVVTGMPTAERSTATGLFTIPYKETNVTLKGANYSTPVTYWMPFHDGQGLHDATWRGSFGGSIYASNGSHGCVNMPYSAAEIVYSEMEENTPIFLYN